MKIENKIYWPTVERQKRKEGAIGSQVGLRYVTREGAKDQISFANSCPLSPQLLQSQNQELALLPECRGERLTWNLSWQSLLSLSSLTRPSPQSSSVYTHRMHQTFRSPTHSQTFHTLCPSNKLFAHTFSPREKTSFLTI